MPAPDLQLTKLYSYTEQGPGCPARITIKRDQFGRVHIAVRGRGETCARQTEEIEIPKAEFAAMVEQLEKA